MATIKRVPMALKCARWCKRSHVLDCSFYDIDCWTRYAWEMGAHLVGQPLAREVYFTPYRRFRDILGHDRYDEAIATMQAQGRYSDRHMIGMCTEGALNHAIHYGTDDRLLKRFTKFLDKWGYELYTLGNCYNFIVPKACPWNPASVEVQG